MGDGRLHTRLAETFARNRRAMQRGAGSSVAECCGEELELLGAQESRQFRVEATRCPRCGGVHWSNTRIDGQDFWVGALGLDVQRMERELAERLGVKPPAGTLAVYDVCGKTVLRV